MRRFLLDTFGQASLACGSGVLDVGGGKGELSFELLNLNSIRATIIDPRPGSLHKHAKWLKVPMSCHACAIFCADCFPHWNSQDRVLLLSPEQQHWDP